MFCNKPSIITSNILMSVDFFLLLRTNIFTMKKKYLLLSALALSIFPLSFAGTSVEIDIDTKAENKTISPYIYGRNGVPQNDDEFNYIKESGVKMERLNNGNNVTKYNFRKKLTCHPDWYNNVYSIDWDEIAQQMQEKLPNVQGIFGFQLLGKVPFTNAYNFNDWEYNKSQWWSGCANKMCGGGTFNSDGSVANLGDVNLFMVDWPADSTTEILNYWEKDLHLDMNQFQYWNMDNEMDIWGGTHSDLAPNPYTDDFYEQMMQNYFSVAKAARKKNPNIKLCGPNAASEWTWFYGCSAQPNYNGKKYNFLEYFIMRCAEEQKKTGIKMIDVFDLHFYPGETEAADILQSHRVLYDKNYIYPGANGVKTINGGWDESQKKEYIFERCQTWLDQYFGENHGITFAIGEYNVNTNAPEMVKALSYASVIGEGAKHGLEYFSPWTWTNSMWEVVHLFSSYAKNINVSSVSANDSLLSAYTSVNVEKDSMTIVLVNRSPSTTFSPQISISNTKFADGNYTSYTLAGLGDSQTFKSHTENALTTGTISVANNEISGFEVPAYSIMAIVLSNGTSSIEDNIAGKTSIALYPNPTSDIITISATKQIEFVEIFNAQGIAILYNMGNSDQVKINIESLDAGNYFAVVKTANSKETLSFIVK